VDGRAENLGLVYAALAIEAMLLSAFIFLFKSGVSSKTRLCSRNKKKNPAAEMATRA
jgi:hypothetical protein